MKYHQDLRASKPTGVHNDRRCGLGVGDACPVEAAAIGEIKILRRLPSPAYVPYVDEPGTRLALVVDVETTGLRPARTSERDLSKDSEAEPTAEPDEVLELAAVPLTYRVADGAVLAVHPPFAGLRQPSKPISAEVEALTGLDAAAVHGRSISLEDVSAVVDLDKVALVLAHKAAFDKAFLCAFEPLAAVFAGKPWACTIEDAGWREAGIASSKLEYVAAFGFGFFYPPHRAEIDCLAVVEILGRTMPGADETVLAKVLRSARRGRWRVEAFLPFSATRGPRVVETSRLPLGSRRPRSAQMLVPRRR